MKPNLAVSIYIRSSIKFLYFVPLHQQIWPPRTPSSFRGEDFLPLANQKEELILAAMFVGRMEPNEEAL
jgi:hypothetical protein